MRARGREEELWMKTGGEGKGEEEGGGGGGGGRGRTPVNVVIRFCLPCIEKHTKNQVYIFFRNILNNVYNDRI